MKAILLFLVLILSVFGASHEFFYGGYPTVYPRVYRTVRYVRPMYGSVYNPYYSRIW
jgi:hypothetical protein